MKLRRASLAASIAFATAITLFSSSSAYAGTDARACNGAINTYGACAGEGWFVADGDEYYIWDNKSDSHGVTMTIQDHNGGRQRTCNAGAGNYCKYVFNVPEGSSVEIYVCLTEQNRTISGTCGYAVRGKA